MDESKDTPNCRVLFEKHEDPEIKTTERIETENLEEVSKFQLSTIMYEQADECMRKNTLHIMDAIYKAIFLGGLNPRKEIEKWLEFIELGKKQKIMFGAPYYSDYISTISVMDLLISKLCDFKKNELYKNEKHQLDLLSSKIYDLVSIGTYVDKELLTLLPLDLLKKHNSYLSNLKKL